MASRGRRTTDTEAFALANNMNVMATLTRSGVASPSRGALSSMGGCGGLGGGAALAYHRGSSGDLLQAERSNQSHTFA